MKSRVFLFTAALVGGMLATNVNASFFQSADNLVLVRLSEIGATSQGSVPAHLDQYTPAGVFVNSLALPSAGGDAITMSQFLNHDAKLHRSVDSRYLTIPGYRVAAGGSLDPSSSSAQDFPRVVARIDAFGAIDTSTVLPDAFEGSSIRAAVSVDGTQFWLGGDSAGGTTTSGGTRYTTLGSSTSVNLSQVQAIGGDKTPDNIRNVAIFGGQLYNSSGSDASVGRNVFAVGSGLPTSGSQSLTAIAPVSANVSSFFFLDLSDDEPGLDTLYTSGNNLRKFTKTNGEWVASGTITSANTQSNILAAVENDQVVIYQATPTQLQRFVDASGYGNNITGAFTTLVTAASGEEFRGLAFAPAIPEPTSLGFLLGGAALLISRRRR